MTSTFDYQCMILTYKQHSGSAKYSFNYSGIVYEICEYSPRVLLYLKCASVIVNIQSYTIIVTCFHYTGILQYYVQIVFMLEFFFWLFIFESIMQHIFLVQVQHRTEVLCTPSSTQLGCELMTSRSWQYNDCSHWDACSNHSAFSDFGRP